MTFKILALQRMQAAKFEPVTYNSKAYNNWMQCLHELRGSIKSPAAVLTPLFKNLGRWFDGYLGHVSVDWDDASVKMMAKHLRAISTYYPVPVPKSVYRVTTIKVPKNSSDADILKMRKIPEHRRVLSFSADPDYPKTFWNRVRKSDWFFLELSDFKDKRHAWKQDIAVVIYEVQVKKNNLLACYDSILKFAEVTPGAYDAYTGHLREKNESPDTKFVKGRSFLWPFDNSMRPFIQRQREAVMLFPTTTVSCVVKEVLINTANYG